MCFYLMPVCFLLAAVYMHFELKKQYVPAVILKGLASLTFVIFGIAGSSLCKDQRFAKLVVIGLILGAVADVLLNLRYVFPKVGKQVFLFGILVFLSGHVFYLAALIPLCKNPVVYILAGLAATCLLVIWIFRHITAEKAFKIFGVVYVGTITVMNFVALGALIADPCERSYLFFAGAVLFLISDIVLIFNTFGKESKDSLRITNLALYYVGQILIALSLHFG